MTMTAKKTTRSGCKRFDQLRGAARKRAVEVVQEMLNGAWFEAELVTELLTTDLESEYGMPGMKVYWSLGHCQGDGVAFEGELDLWEMAKHDTWLDAWLKKHQVLWTLGDYDDGFNADLVTPYVYVHHSGRYYHWNSMNVDCDADGLDFEGGMPDWYDEFVRKLRDHLNERVKTISRALEKTGYEEIEYQTSEERAVEEAKANNLLFDRDGELV